MKICNLKIKNFRGIKSADLYFPAHAVIIGDNNTGKSTVLEALDLVLGPDRLYKKPVIDEHDFYLGKYIAENNADAPKIKIDVTITELTQEQEIYFSQDFIEWWDENSQKLHNDPPASSLDVSHIKSALRITFLGEYSSDDDDFIGNTYFTRTLLEYDNPEPFTKRHKQFVGFLYLRALRTGSRALSLESGSLLDIILRLKEIRPQMWEKTINELSTLQAVSNIDSGVSDVLESIEESMKKFVPKEWGISPHLKISNMTRQHLRKTITAFVATGSGEHAAPFYCQGRGTINILILAMLSQIARDKQNVIFAMEEPETAIPPYTQKRIVHEIKNISSQSILTSHSPYVIEDFNIDETIVLYNGNDGEMVQRRINLPQSIKQKRYMREFRTRFCEGLLARRVLITEGKTEFDAFPSVARRLNDLNSAVYSTLEALGICIIDGGTQNEIASLSKLYKSLGKIVYAMCDDQKNENRIKIEQEADKLFMHNEKGFEDLVCNGTTDSAVNNFFALIEYKQDTKFSPKENLNNYLKSTKGTGGAAQFLSSCNEEEIPIWLRNVCIEIKNLSS